MIFGPSVALARGRTEAYLEGRDPLPPNVVMAQPLHPTRPIQDNSSTAGRLPSVLLLAGAGIGGLVLLGALALWFHYGSQVFFEMIRTGFAACF